MPTLKPNQVFPDNKIILDFITLKDKNDKDGRQKRYFKVLCFNTETKTFDDVTLQIYQTIKNKADFTFKENCFVEVGCGMDMAFNLSYNLKPFLNTEEQYFWVFPRKLKDKQEEMSWCLERILNKAS